MKITSLPRSFNALKDIYRRTGIPSILNDPRSSDLKLRQGVRATSAQGTSSMANTPNPLVPGGTLMKGIGSDDPMETPPIFAFSTVAPDYDQVEGTIVQEKGWPQNPSRTEIGNAPADRSEQQLYSGSLHLGPPPGRIIRYLPERNAGFANGMLTGETGSPGFPWNGDFGHVNHLKIARQALGTKGPQKLSDDNAAIPAVYAGNPRP